jgi:hypothetical protein
VSKPVNLNKVRKDRARAEKRARADENAVRFGQTKAQKQAGKSARDKADRHLDGHKRDR